MTNKVAVITGSAVGIGRAIAVTLGKAGARVVINYSKSEAEAQETARLVREAGAEAEVIRADVAVDVEARALMDGAAERFGRLDVLVNNAGITRFVPFPDLEALTDEVWDRLYEVNVKGAFFCARAAAPHMQRLGEGRIINISSQAGIRAAGSSIAYCVSKAALIQLSNTLAVALGPEIRVNCVAPGFIDDTRWNAGRDDLDQTREKVAASAPLGRVGYPDDIAEAALYFASGANYSTGAVLTVDGGRTL